MSAKKMEAPCHTCDHRQLCCHASCAAYAAYRDKVHADRDALRESLKYVGIPQGMRAALEKKIRQKAIKGK